MRNTPPKLCGIYAIYSAINDTIYVGHSSSITKRWYNHKSQLRRGVHTNPHLQNAWNKYGGSAFEFYILEECSVELLLEREQYYIDLYPVRYNLAPVAGSTLGIMRTPEQKAKMSATMMGNTRCLGNILSDEHKANISAGGRGLKRSPTTRAKISEANKGKKLSDEAKAKISEANKGNTYCVGREMPPDTRKKIGDANRGRKHSAETKAKMSAAHKARAERQQAEIDVDG